MKPTKNLVSRLLLGTTVLFLAITDASLGADRESSADKQRKLIAILKSDAPPQDKAIPCKQLAIYGDKDAVPVLAPLLANKDLASWARIALQAIPGPEADAALREALPKLQGNLLIGVMNSIGVRRDAKAVDGLAGKLTDADVEVVAAAAAALGNIGGTQAAKALNQAFSSGRKETLSAVAEGVGYLSTVEVAQALLSSLSAPYREDDQRRVIATSALGQLQNNEAIGVIRDALEWRIVQDTRITALLAEVLAKHALTEAGDTIDDSAADE